MKLYRDFSALLVSTFTLCSLKVDDSPGILIIEFNEQILGLRASGSDVLSSGEEVDLDVLMVCM